MVQFRTDQPVQVVQGHAHLVGIGEAVHGVDAENEAALDLAVEHPVHDVHVGIIDARFPLGQQPVAEVVFRRGFVAEPALSRLAKYLGRLPHQLALFFSAVTGVLALLNSSRVCHWARGRAI